MLCDHCALPWTIPHIPGPHWQRNHSVPALSSIVGISLPVPVLPEVHFCLDRMEISLVPRQTDLLPSTNDWQKSFLPRAYFVPVPKRDLDVPPMKGIKL